MQQNANKIFCMKHLKQILLCVAMILGTINVSAANDPQTVYIYGFAASFNDSTVYITEIQQLDSAYIDSKTKFLYSRNNYSAQMRDYLQTVGFPHATCITSFALKRKDAEKKYLKLRKRYLEKGAYNIKYLKESDFKFQAIKPQ